MRVVIIGGSAGGASVAARLRRLDESVEIVMLERSNTISFANCGIPYYLGDVIKDRSRLTVVDKEDFEKLLNVDVRTRCEVISIDKKRKTIKVKNLSTNKTYKEKYDKLVLSPGGRPIIPDVKGIDSSHVFSLRSAEDTDAVKSYIKNSQCKEVLVIGAGFIGLELAENFKRIGLDVNIVDMADQVMSSWDYEMVTILHHHLRSKGVNLILNDAVKEVYPDSALLESGKKINAQLIILCIGVNSETKLADGCELSVGQHGGIRVNDGMVTSDESIYALGDAVEVRDRITHSSAIIPLAGVAHKQARVVADNICGHHRIFRDVQLTAIAKVFDLDIAMTGKSETDLIANHINYKKSYIEVPSHAGYYPDAHPMLFKLLFAAKTGRILGAQIIGADGVDKRIDVIATAINFGKTVYDLIDLELAYAPPFSSAKDPVNIAGMVAKNMLRENYNVIHWDELDALKPEATCIIDVRTQEEFELNSIEGSINIPLEEIRQRVNELPRDKKIVVYCQQGKKGYFAYRILKQNGIDDIVNLCGGFKLYHLIKSDKVQAGIFDLDVVTKNDDVQVYIKKEAEEIETNNNNTDTAADNIIEIDASGLSCPGPILRLKKAMRLAVSGDIVKITATDIGFFEDVKTWSRQKGYKLLSLDNREKKYTAELQKCT